MSIRREIVKFIYSNPAFTHTNLTLAANLHFPEPSVRRATREAVEAGDLLRYDNLGFLEFKLVPVESVTV